HPLDAEVHGGIQNRTAALGRPERNRLLAALEPHRPEQADHAEEMVGVHVREEDVTDREARLEPHHLTLRALAAIEEHLLALTVEVDRTDVAADRRAAGGGAETGDPDHPFASHRNRYAPMARNAYPTYRVRGHGVATGPSNRRRSTPSRINSTRRPCLASIAIAVASRIPVTSPRCALVSAISSAKTHSAPHRSARRTLRPARNATATQPSAARRSSTGSIAPTYRDREAPGKRRRSSRAAPETAGASASRAAGRRPKTKRHRPYWISGAVPMPGAGFEPARLAASDFKSPASARSAT